MIAADPIEVVQRSGDHTAIEVLAVPGAKHIKRVVALQGRSASVDTPWVSASASNEGQGEQARAEHRETGRHQRQKATAHKIAMGHEASSIGPAS